MKEIINAVQKMQEYIEEHIKEEITLVDLSKVSYFSPWYSYRLFTKYTKETPADYIRKLRLSKASEMLKKEKWTISNVAFEVGFKSVDGFIRAFTHEFGITPGTYKLKPVPITLFIPYGVKYKELKKEREKMTNVKNIFIQVVDKPERKVIIKRGINAEDYWTYCNEVGCDVWGTLVSMDSLSGEPVCLWLPKKYIKENTSKYVQGVEVSIDYQGEIPEGFDVITLPKEKYLMFGGEPFNEEDYCEAIQQVQEGMEKYNPEVIGYCWDDSIPTIQLEPRGERGYIQ